MESQDTQTIPAINESEQSQVLKECSNSREDHNLPTENELKDPASTEDKKNKASIDKLQAKTATLENIQENHKEELLALQPKGSLQESFEKFRKKRIENSKYNKYLKDMKEKDHKTDEFKDVLRQKFIETAKKYYGVPYGKRFHQPGEPLYDAPIFLDCCGLIRQVVFDLREDFGFTLQRWNQVIANS